jgi:hypothetical protein
MVLPSSPIARFIQNDARGNPLPAILSIWHKEWGDITPENLEIQMKRHEADIATLHEFEFPNHPIIALQRQNTTVV